MKSQWPVLETAPILGLRDGDLVTIAGIRRKADGSFTTKCKPGNETVFQLRIK